MTSTPPQRINERTLLTFMDELTSLARKYQLVIDIGSEGDTAAVHQASFEEVNQGRYVMVGDFDENDKSIVYGPVDIMFLPDADLSNEVIDIDNI